MKAKERADRPLPWWGPATDADHAEWLAQPVSAPIPFAELSPFQPWVPGTPVLINSGEDARICYVKLIGASFHPRWLTGGFAGRTVSRTELTPNDPRKTWTDSFELQLALALLVGDKDERTAWLADPDPATEPGICELLALAKQEIRR